MAYTSMKTWAFGAILTAAELNTYVRDNIEFLKARTDGTIFSGVEGVRGTNLSLSTGAATDITYVTASYNYDTWWVSGATFTVPAAAIPAGFTSIAVFCQVRARFASNATGYRRLRFLLNGAAAGSISVDANSGAETEVSITDFLICVAGDTIKAEAFQNSGGNLNLEVSTIHVVRYAPVA